MLAEAAAGAGVALATAVVDVTDAAGRRSLVTEVQPWAVVNNAGFMNVGQVVDVAAEDALRRAGASPAPGIAVGRKKP